MSFAPNGLLGPLRSPPKIQSSSSRTSYTLFHTLKPLILLLASPLRATTSHGDPVYLTRKTRVQDFPNMLKPSTQLSNHRFGSLLDVPVHRMIDQLSAATAAKLSVPDSVPTHKPQSQTEDTLWVDRYRPHKFSDLMGNERVARETMGWVKQWDWCVFGTKRGRKRPRDGDENWGGGEDEYHRPKEKILLLSGPPGLGKTTLAHVVARQAGYEVMEINASDARSGQIVDDRIRPTLEAGSAIGSRKPVLVLIDEIDGATGGEGGGFIHKLVQLTQDKPHKKGRSNHPKSSRPLLRPIICICNDSNTSSLSKLRPCAHQIRFTRPADTHTVKRLREVCESEGMRAEARALSTLVGVARGDLRGCLNTLQFVKSRNEDVTEAVIRAATVGMKEADTTVTSVLNSLFLPMGRKRVKDLGMGEEEEARYVGRLSREVEGCGRENSIADGCFSYYATLHQHDATFSRYEKANEWLVTYDVFSGTMYNDGEYGLHQYLSYMLVPLYPLFQERGGERVEKSRTDWEQLQKTRASEEIYKSLSQCLRSASGRQGGDYRHLVSTPILQLEFAPYINRIISPPLRPVNSQIIRPEEKYLLARLVEIMAALELRFVQEKAEDGQLVYRLDPPIDVFVTYDGKRAADIAVPRYAVRHLVAGEIDAKLIAHQANDVDKDKSDKANYFGPVPKSSGPSNKHLTDIADKPPTDFFGRPITVPSAESTKAAVRKNIEKRYRVTYRYLEGNSAAVRKSVKVEAFL